MFASARWISVLLLTNWGESHCHFAGLSLSAAVRSLLQIMILCCRSSHSHMTWHLSWLFSYFSLQLLPARWRKIDISYTIIWALSGCRHSTESPREHDVDTSQNSRSKASEWLIGKLPLSDFARFAAAPPNSVEYISKSDHLSLEWDIWPPPRHTKNSPKLVYCR